MLARADARSPLSTVNGVGTALADSIRVPPKQERRQGNSLFYVSIVSTNPETIDGLQEYFTGVGVASHSTRALKDLGMVAPEFATAAVLFPDDFGFADVKALLRELRGVRPHLLVLLVTRSPQQFDAELRPDGRSLTPIVLPKPSFGWDIVDAIRAHVNEAQALGARGMQRR